MNKKIVKHLLITLTALAPITYAQADNTPCCYVSSSECDLCCSGFTQGVDFIYLRASADHNTYATEIQSIGNVTYLKKHNLNYGYQPGFRVRVKKTDIQCCWDLGAEYTYLSGSQSRQLTAEVSEGILNRFNYNFAKAKGSFQYNNLDILLGRNIELSECHRLTPFFGVDMLWFNQDFTRYYEQTPLETTTQFQRAKWKSDLNAYGLKAGSLYNLSLGCGFNLYGTAAGSILYADLDVRHRWQDGVFDNQTGVVTESINILDLSKPCNYVFGWQVGAGIDYRVNICSFPVVFNLGYQFIQWYNIAVGNDDEFLDRDDTSTWGLNGLVFGLNASF